MFKNLLNKLAGDPYQKDLVRYQGIVDEVNVVESAIRSELGISETGTDEITDSIRAYFSQKTAEFKTIIAEATDGLTDDEAIIAAREETLLSILPEAFATIRIASQLTIGMRHYDVQIIGGIVLHEGKIAEMKTGEGKTLVATLPLYLNALTGDGAHLVTVNDYLARRDGGWMGPIYDLLGLSLSVIGKERYSAIYDPDYVDPGGELDDERLVHWRPIPRRECYRADITYGTSSEFGFDYLRDNTAIEYHKTVQRTHTYVIVDEVDSVLVDSARTPLIISGPAAKASSTYQRFTEIVNKARLRRNKSDIEHGEEPDGDYVLDDRTRNISLTDRGTEKIEKLLPEINIEEGQSIYDPQFYELVHFLENALKAKYTFERNKQYIVQDGSVILIDQTTGRPMPSRRYSEGLHQAIESKEGVAVKREDVTIATITVQNYFRMYDKLSGMTGTALTQAEEFDQVYDLDVIAIPTNVEYRADSGDFETERTREQGAQIVTYWDRERSDDQPVFFKRIDYPDEVYQSIPGKFNAVIKEIRELHGMGRPILIGTGSVEASELLSSMLRKGGIPHEVLNAKNHQREALIVAQAGREGAITLSTSMAGRGTDILLGGNPEGLASKLINDKCFTHDALKRVVSSVIKGELDKARATAKSEKSMVADIVDWIVKENQALIQKAQVEDILTQVAKDIIEEPEYKDLSFDLVISIIQQMNLASIDQKRMEKAAQMAEESNLPPSFIPELEYRLNQYRSLKGLLGQAGHTDVLTQNLMEKHFNARSALVRSVLNGDNEEAEAITTSIPGLPLSLIEDIQGVHEDCDQSRARVWDLGGLHVIGTERHESRRIDDQLRGRAARQGDPGSSRFYLSLEDDLMIRFGGDRTKGMMERFNIPEDMPISANILSNAIEQAQSRFEAYNFEIRKNLIEYDEAVNRQRQIVYDERMSILSGHADDLDEMLSRFVQETVTSIIARYRVEFEEWVMGEIEPIIVDFSNYENNTVNNRGVLTRIRSLMPRIDEEGLKVLLEINDPDELSNAIHEIILDGMDDGYQYKMMLMELSRVVPIWPVMPTASSGKLEGWDDFVKRSIDVIELYGESLETETITPIVNTLKKGLEELQRDFLIWKERGTEQKTMRLQLSQQAGTLLSGAFIEIQDGLEDDELLESLLCRVEDVLDIARQEPPEDKRISLERNVFSIGEDQLNEYERALMLQNIDQEWRQYLVAIDDLRSGISLEAYGQRDPKVQFKRRAFEMFDKLRIDVQEGIARRFFSDLPRRRQIIEAQAKQEAMLDQLAQQGYRVQRKVTRTKSGKRKVSQTLEKDVWSNVGRNDPCPCGSGKKFKDCHYRTIQQQARTVDIDEVKSKRPGSKKTRRR